MLAAELTAAAREREAFSGEEEVTVQMLASAEHQLTYDPTDVTTDQFY